jgi:hypothetical protein
MAVVFVIEIMNLVMRSVDARVVIIPLMEWISTIFQFARCKILKNIKSIQKKNWKSSMNCPVVVNRCH